MKLVGASVALQLFQIDAYDFYAKFSPMTFQSEDIIEVGPLDNSNYIYLDSSAY